MDKKLTFELFMEKIILKTGLQTIFFLLYYKHKFKNKDI